MLKKILSLIFGFLMGTTKICAAEFNRVYLKTSDNVKIALNHYESGHKAVLIIAHGWFMTKDSKAFSDLANEFKSDYDVIVFDFRGHGKSSGCYTFTSKEVLDLDAVVEFAKQKYENVYLMGFSLGGAVSVIRGDEGLDKMILVSTPNSFDTIENEMWKKEAWLPTFQKFELNRWCSIRPSLIIRKKVKPIKVVDKIQVPTLFIAGGKDPTVHAWHTESLYKKAICPKNYQFFEMSYHAEDLYLQESEKFLQICRDWLKNSS